MTNKEFKTAIDRAKANLLKDGELMPVFIGFGHDPVADKKCCLIVATPWVGNTFDEVEKSKTDSITVVKGIFIAYDVQQYVFLSETWMKAAKSREEVDEYRKKKKLLADDPDRIECLLCANVTHGGSEQVMFKMQRNSKGGICGFEELPSEGAKFSGRMLELLPPKGAMEKYANLAVRKLMVEALERIGQKPYTEDWN